jgi:predicted GNAT superfamily acetyltransferase
MNINIRPAQAADMAFILTLNETNVEVLSPMDGARFAYFMEVSDLFQIAEVDGKPAAFLIALREGIPDYTSENYIWFSKQYERFLYIDRIVIGEGFRHDGLGRQLYQEVFQRAADCGVDTVTAEVDIIPYNDPSLKFHKAMGFREVGQQVIRGGEIKVSLQVRE